METHLSDPCFSELREECLEILHALDQLPAPCTAVGGVSLYATSRASLQEIVDGAPLTPARVLDLTTLIRVLAMFDCMPEVAGPPIALNRAARRAAQYGGRR